MLPISLLSPYRHPPGFPFLCCLCLRSISVATAPLYFWIPVLCIGSASDLSIVAETLPSESSSALSLFLSLSLSFRRTVPLDPDLSLGILYLRFRCSEAELCCFFAFGRHTQNTHGTNTRYLGPHDAVILPKELLNWKIHT